MKKLILVTLFIIPLFASAQNFPLVKEGGIWRDYTAGGGFPPDPYWHSRSQFVMTGDTIIFNKTFTKVYATNYDSIISSKSYIGAMREDTLGRVFFVKDSAWQGPLPNYGFTDSSETVLYDFSLAVGDTFRIPNSIDSIQIVNTIDSILIEGQWRKKYNFHFASISMRVWVEGIGDLKGLFFPAHFEFEWWCVLTCYEDSQIFWTNPDWGSDCLSAGIEDKLEISNDELIIFPNPAKNELNIKFSENTTHQSLNITIYNSIGVKVKSIEIQNNLKVDIKDLKSGIHFIQVQSEDKMFYNSKFVKL